MFPGLYVFLLYLPKKVTSTTLIYSPQCHTYPVILYMKQDYLFPTFKQKLQSF